MQLLKVEVARFRGYAWVVALTNFIGDVVDRIVEFVAAMLEAGVIVAAAIQPGVDQADDYAEVHEV